MSDLFERIKDMEQGKIPIPSASDSPTSFNVGSSNPVQNMNGLRPLPESAKLPFPDK